MDMITVFVIMFLILLAAFSDGYRQARRIRRMESYRLVFEFFHNLFHLNTEKDNRKNMRTNALNIAKPFLTMKNKRNIWSDMILSNDSCIISLDKNGVGIRVVERKNQRRSFKIVSSKAYSIEELWNKFCISFTYNTNYDGLLELMNVYKTEIMEVNIYFPEKDNEKPEYFEEKQPQIGINPKFHFQNNENVLEEHNKEIGENKEDNIPEIYRNDERSVDL